MAHKVFSRDIDSGPLHLAGGNIFGIAHMSELLVIQFGTVVRLKPDIFSQVQESKPDDLSKWRVAKKGRIDVVICSWWSSRDIVDMTSRDAYEGLFWAEIIRYAGGKLLLAQLGRKSNEDLVESIDEIRIPGEVIRMAVLASFGHFSREVQEMTRGYLAMCQRLPLKIIVR